MCFLTICPLTNTVSLEKVVVVDCLREVAEFQNELCKIPSLYSESAKLERLQDDLKLKELLSLGEFKL